MDWQAIGRAVCELLPEKVPPVARAFHPVRTTWRARMPAPPTFSCWTGGPQAHEELP